MSAASSSRGWVLSLQLEASCSRRAIWALTQASASWKTGEGASRERRGARTHLRIQTRSTGKR